MIINDDPLSFGYYNLETEIKNSFFEKISNYKLNQKIIDRSKNILISILFLSNLFLLNSPFIGENPVFAKEESGILNNKVQEKESSITISQNVTEKNTGNSVNLVTTAKKSIINDSSSKILFENFNLVASGETNKIFQKFVEESKTRKETEKKKEKQEELTENLKEMMKGHPMAEMSDLIAQEDEIVAALIIGIGKKESNWGKRSPKKDGQDCYNYWGYKTSGSRGQALGHACFGSKEEAVKTIAKRINTLVKENKRDTPAEMIVWKCGSTCKGHDPESVKKWISDVQLYYNKVIYFNKKIEEKKNEEVIDKRIS